MTIEATRSERPLKARMPLEKAFDGMDPTAAILCLWSASGLILGALLLASGFGGEIASALTMSG